MKNTKVRRKNLIFIGFLVLVFPGLMSAYSVSIAALPCYMENSSGEVVNLEGICREIDTVPEEENVHLDYEATDVTPFEYGDIIDGVQIVGPNEVAYSNGVRRLYNPDTGMLTFVKPDGSEALPGEKIEIPEGGGEVVVESVGERIRYLESHLQDESFWSTAVDSEETAMYREGLERQLENLKNLAK